MSKSSSRKIANLFYLNKSFVYAFKDNSSKFPATKSLAVIILLRLTGDFFLLKKVYLFLVFSSKVRRTCLESSGATEVGLYLAVSGQLSAARAG